jgi:hypothetical protein
MAITQQALSALRGLEGIDWSALSHPYGCADDVPGHLRGLLAEPDTDDAGEAAIFFAAYFVCNESHFGDATPAALPFMLRLLSAPGVSRRGALMASVISILRICVDDTNDQVEPALKHACLDAMARESTTIIDLARLLEGHGFDRDIEALVVAFADTIGPLASTVRTPQSVRAILDRMGVAARQGSPRDHVVAWAARQKEARAWPFVSNRATYEEECFPSEGEYDEDNPPPESASPAPPAPVDWEARYREDCATAEMPRELTGERQALSDLYMACRLRREFEQAVFLPSVGMRLSLRRPAVHEGRVLSRRMLLRALLRGPSTGAGLSMDAWIESDGEGRWVALLVENPGSFRELCRLCSFIIAEATRAAH